MSNLIQVHIDTSNEDYLTEKIEQGELFILCRDNVDDTKGTYCVKGKSYEVVNMTNTCWIIEGEGCLVSINKWDYDFIPIIKGGDKVEN